MDWKEEVEKFQELYNEDGFSTESHLLEEFLTQALTSAYERGKRDAERAVVMGMGKTFNEMLEEK